MFIEPAKLMKNTKLSAEMVKEQGTLVQFIHAPMELAVTVKNNVVVRAMVSQPPTAPPS